MDLRYNLGDKRPPKKMSETSGLCVQQFLGMPKSWKRHLGMLLDTLQKMASQFAGPLVLIFVRSLSWMIRPLGTSQC